MIFVIKMKRNISLIIFFLINTIIYPQFITIELDRYTINDGLSNNAVNAFIQTSDGYLWIATKDGLNRFDGQNFKIFKTDTKTKNALPENYIMSLYESKAGTLWVGTWGAGLCRYDKIYERFIVVDKNRNNDYVQCINEDDDGNIWYGTENNGLKKFDIKKNKIFPFDDFIAQKLSLPTKNIMAIIHDKRKNLWIASLGGGIICYNYKQNRLQQFLSGNNPDKLKSNFVWELVNETDSTLLIGTNTGVQRLNINSKKFSALNEISKENQRLLTNVISRILIDNFSRIWIGTYNYGGLFIIDRKEYRPANMIHLQNEYGNPQSLICGKIRCLYKDKFGNIWIGTEDGLNKFPNQKKFVRFKNLPYNKNGLSGNVVSSILEADNNILYVGYGGNGFDKIDLKNNSLKHFGYSSVSGLGLSDADVICMFNDKNNILWIGTGNGGLNKFNPVTERFKSFRHDRKNPYSINSEWVQQILETSDGKLLVGTNDGIQIFDRSSERFYNYQPVKKNNNNKLPPVFSVNSLFEDREKNIWIGTWLNGLYRYDPFRDTLINYLPDSKKNSISGNKISCIYQDEKGIIWIGTFNNGLNKFDKQNDKFKHFKTSDGLPNDVVFGILEDKKSNLWFSTLKGLVKFNPETERFIVYEKEDGLVDNQFNWHAYFKNSKNEMYFGGKSGFVRFNPDSITVDDRKFPVVLTNFKVFDKEAPLPKSLPMTKEIILENYQNFFSIDFTALDLQPTHKHKFAYKLDGIDPDWVYSGFRATAFYTDIKHGKYKFSVKAMNSDGIWSPITSIFIQIKPAWWNTWWFRILLVIFVLVLLYIGYKIRMNQLLKIERIRFNIASDLHDEIGSNLSSISVDSQSLILGNNLSGTEKELATDISKTAKETVDSMRDIIWFINPKNDLNEDIIFKMKQTTVKLLVGIDWDISVSEKVRLDLFNLEVRRNIFLLYKEALTNVIKHSHARKCRILIDENSENFYLSVADDGIGFDDTEIKPSTGLRSMENRAKNIKAKLSVISKPNEGTEVKLILKK
jgi:ligand-binding sensor domain-containing protein